MAARIQYTYSTQQLTTSLYGQWQVNTENQSSFSFSWCFWLFDFVFVSPWRRLHVSTSSEELVNSTIFFVFDWFSYSISDFKKAKIRVKSRKKRHYFVLCPCLVNRRQPLRVPFGEALNRRLATSALVWDLEAVCIIHTVLFSCGRAGECCGEVELTGFSDAVWPCSSWLFGQTVVTDSPLLQLAMWRTARGCRRWTNPAGTPRATGCTSTSCSRPWRGNRSPR